MYAVLKLKFVRSGAVVYGGRNSGRNQLIIDRTVESLDEIESGEIFFKCNIKK